MSQKKTIKVPLHRVEGDLEVQAEVRDGVVMDAWCSGVMYRGFENILTGRAALDSLVIAPRICGICTTAHLTAAVQALDMIAGVSVPADAGRLRNVALMAELVQNDVRHSFLIFAVDLANPFYKASPLFEEAVRRYQPFQGQTVIEVIKETKKILEIVAIIGGQWPHSSYMAPGGIVSLPSDSDLLQCQLLGRQFRKWYERRVLGCTLERWSQVKSAADLEAWLEESPDHRDSDLGFFLRFARSIGLDKIGRGPGAFVNFGGLELPLGTRVRGAINQNRLSPAGFVRDGRVGRFDPGRIAEDVAYSWYDDEDGGLHPAQGRTRPYATGGERGKYSWAKAPRYDGLPAETGPLAELVIAGHPLITDLLERGGPSVLVRQLARIIRPVELLPALEIWIAETSESGRFYNKPGELVEGEGHGLTSAARGAVGHWVRLRNGLIDHYQVITPTAWNASPRDAGGAKGPLEEALVGTPVRDLDNPLELGHVVRSYDLCLVCTVHAAGR
ncbi:MAG: nickel-dependent hydrogenase large subunit [Thermodesulfobacteriota bacterium]